MCSDFVDSFVTAALLRRGLSLPSPREYAPVEPPPAAAERPSRRAKAGAGHKVLILGGDSDHNLGDQAILHAFCEQLQHADPGVQISIASSRWRADRFPGVRRVLPRGPAGLPATLRCARSQDLVIVGGGGLFQDDDSRIKMPYWAARLALLRRFNPNLRAHALGAGPLQHPESRWCARQACRLLRDVSVRDSYAQQWLATCTDRPPRLTPDPAFALSAAPLQQADEFLRAHGLDPRRPIIGVAMRRWFHRLGGFLPHRLRAQFGLDRGAGDAEIARLLDQVAAAVQALARRLDAAVLLLPSYDVGHEADSRYCHQLAALLPLDNVRVAQLDDPRLYKAVCGRLRLMISSRMHPLIFAAGMGVPGVGLGYNGKFAAYFDMLGIPPRLAWLDDFRDGAQAERLTSLGEAALADGTDLRDRCELLRRRVIHDIAALLERDSSLAAD